MLDSSSYTLDRAGSNQPEASWQQHTCNILSFQTSTYGFSSRLSSYFPPFTWCSILQEITTSTTTKKKIEKTESETTGRGEDSCKFVSCLERSYTFSSLFCILKIMSNDFTSRQVGICFPKQYFVYHPSTLVTIKIIVSNNKCSIFFSFLYNTPESFDDTIFLWLVQLLLWLNK